MTTVLGAVAVVVFSALPPRSPAGDNPATAVEPDRLARLLTDSDPAARRRVLAEFAGSAAVAEKYRPVLWQALRDKDKVVRQLAAMALAASGLADPPVLAELLRAMGEADAAGYGPRLEGPSGAKRALVKLGAQGVPALVAALEG